MRFTGHVEVRETYVYGVFTGTFDLAEAKKEFGKALDICARTALTRVLLDARAVQGPVSVGQRYEWGSFIAEAHQAHVAAGHPPVRFAMLLSDAVLDPERLGETVAANRGADVKGTSDAADAAAWLGIDVQSIR